MCDIIYELGHPLHVGVGLIDLDFLVLRNESGAQPLLLEVPLFSDVSELDDCSNCIAQSFDGCNRPTKSVGQQVWKDCLTEQ